MMKRNLICIVFIVTACAYNLLAQVNGNASLQGPEDHSGILVKFTKQTEPFITDSAYTTANGDYNITISEGLYKITFSKEGFNQEDYNSGSSVFLNSDSKLYDVALTESYLSNILRLEEDPISISGLVHRGSGVLTNGVMHIINRSTRVTKIGKINIDGTFKVDSTGTGSFYFYAIPAPNSGGGYLPTYYVNKTRMQDAVSIFSQGNVSGLDIYLVQLTGPEAGVALLEGRFSYGDGNSDDNTDFSKNWFNNSYTPTSPINIFTQPCKNMPVVLYNSANKIIAQTVTDLQGYYSFPNLTGGSYRIEGQRLNYITESGGYLNVAASGTTQTSLRMVIEQVLGLNDPSSSDSNTLSYPNPFQNKLSLLFKGQLIITDITGNVFLENSSFEGGEIQTENWPKGVYLVKCAGSVSKILKN